MQKKKLNTSAIHPSAKALGFLASKDKFYQRLNQLEPRYYFAIYLDGF